MNVYNTLRMIETVSPLFVYDNVVRLVLRSKKSQYYIKTQNSTKDCTIEKESKVFGPSIKKGGEKPKPIKDHTEEPKSMNG